MMFLNEGFLWQYQKKYKMTSLDVQDKKQKHLAWRLIGPLSVNFLIYLAGTIQVYACNEWIQNRVKVTIFGNETIETNSAACSNHSDPAYSKLTHVQQETSKWQMYNAIALKAASFPAYILVLYTDVFGRRFLFILSSFGNALYFFLSGFIMRFELNFTYLILANVLYGLTGVGLYAASYSYVADVTSPGKERSFSVFLLDTSLPVAGVVGAFVSGYFIEASGFIYPTFTATGIAVIGTFVAIFGIPESLEKKDRIRNPKIFESFIRPFSFYFSKRFNGSRLLFIMLFFAYIFADISVVHRKTMEALYQLGMPFCWSPSKIGLFATFLGLGANVFGVAFLKTFQRYMSDITIAIISTCVTAGSFVLEALASTDTMLYLVAVPACMSYLMSPLIRGTMSTMTPKQHQGALSAGLLVVQTVCSFVGSVTDNRRSL
ncbi:proton-coupled folate transporter-like isoform X2 [Mercenaria mercenaria]|uniref:proton-coupled folate transporter-like isoform X2 n=1 Tax=Mercenaria mercenaria TaxID=6596 RepID=UPI00234EE036|nr:proton-coupled folate transporter-like isoform X2 [Mercenaria mercenaria]